MSPSILNASNHFLKYLRWFKFLYSFAPSVRELHKLFLRRRVQVNGVLSWISKCVYFPEICENRSTPLPCVHDSRVARARPRRGEKSGQCRAYQRSQERVTPRRANCRPFRIGRKIYLTITVSITFYNTCTGGFIARRSVGEQRPRDPDKRTDSTTRWAIHTAGSRPAARLVQLLAKGNK